MSLSKYIQTIRQYPKKTISREELSALFHTADDETLFGIIEKLETGGFLEPVRSSRTNGNLQFPIYLKYRILFPDESWEAELDEISRLHPVLQASGYLQTKPAEYRKHRTMLQRLDRYLFTRPQVLPAVSRKERSFEIFGEEKQLDNTAFYHLLEKLGCNSDCLAFYDTPEYCFNDFIPERKSHMVLLICENKDIWFNIRRRMFEDHADILFGTHIDGVVYGCGNKVTQKESLTTYTRFMGDAQVSYLYWGDIDRAGLNIFLNLQTANPRLDIRLFLPAYEKMLALSRGVTLPDSDDHRERMEDYTSIYELFSDAYREQLINDLETNKRLPQEIISYAVLLQEMRESYGTAF